VPHKPDVLDGPEMGATDLSDPALPRDANPPGPPSPRIYPASTWMRILPALTAIGGMIFGGVLVGVTGKHNDQGGATATSSAASALPSGSALPSAAATTVVRPAPTTVVITRTVAPKPLAKLGDGTYVIPSQASPGTWTTDGVSQINGSLLGCYWARLRSLSGEMSSVIASDNLAPAAQTTISVRTSDTAIKFSGGCQWRRVA
jgi:hypothetical protein